MIVSLSICFFVSSGDVEAKSVVWSTGNIGDNLAYYADCGGACSTIGWVNGLTNFNVNITRQAYAYRNGGYISDGSSIAVGDTISFVAPVYDTDIFWNGTGRSVDTPYGHWLAGAVAPNSVDYASDFVSTRDSYNIYIPLSISPSAIAYAHTGSTAGLDCDGDNIVDINPVGQSCIVMSGGRVETQVNYASTYGKFYYHYTETAGYNNAYLYFNRVAMRKSNMVAPPAGASFLTGTSFPELMQYCLVTGNFASCNGLISDSDYTLSVPAQTIPFTLTAVSNNNLPTTPTVTPQPFTGNTNTAYSFTFTATDPDNDQISYEVDWNNDSLPDTSTPYGASGTSQSLSNISTQWTIAGVYSFKVRAKDTQGGYSAWATPSITLSEVINGTCGVATLVPSGPTPTVGLCTTGTNTIVSQLDTNWVWGCNGSGGGTSTLPTACTTPVETYTLSATKNFGPAAAGTITDITPTGTSINCGTQCTEIVSYNATRTLRANPTSSSISWSGCTSVSGDDCTVSNITSDQTVTATFTRLPEPGVCGPSDGASFSTLNAGSSGLCTSGAVGSFSLSGTTYSWNCNGMMGSPVNDSCFATQTRDYNWREVSP